MHLAAARPNVIDPCVSRGQTVGQKAFEEIEARLLEVNKVVENLDASIRVAAFEFLKPYVVGKPIKVEKPKDDEHDDDTDTASSGDLDELVTKHGDKKPSENARLLSAHWYSIYGSAPFTTKWIEETGATAGLLIDIRVEQI